MRRLPIYFLIDVSESMVGEPIAQVQDGFATIIKTLRKDPYALETVYVSIIAFAGKAQKITPMVELFNFYPPKLPVGGGTSLGNGLEFLMDDIDTSVQKTTLEEKGDWKPLIFLFTDGNPTDVVDKAFERWNKKYRHYTNLIAISLGDNTDNKLLGKITDNVLQLNQTDPASFQEFFKWVTASVQANSKSVAETSEEGLHLAPLTKGFISKIDLEKELTVKDAENFVVILGKCQGTGRPYLIKYQKYISSLNLGSFKTNTLDYNLVGAYPVDDSYFELSDNTASNQKISTSELVGFPNCPCCGNQYGFSHCSCGKIMCTGGEKVSQCPWCGQKAEFSMGGDSFDINRTRG